MSKGIIFEREPPETKKKRIETLPFFEESDGEALARLSSDVERVYEYARRKIPSSGAVKNDDFKRKTIAAVTLAAAYFRMLELRRLFVFPKDEDDLFILLDEAMFGSKKRRAASLFEDDAKAKLLSPLSTLPAARETLESFPLKRLVIFCRENDFSKTPLDALSIIRAMGEPREKAAKEAGEPVDAKTAQAMVSALSLDENDDPSRIILDPCCGSGALLLFALQADCKTLCERGLPLEAAYLRIAGGVLAGFDPDPLAAAAASMNIILRAPSKEFALPRVYAYDAANDPGGMFGQSTPRRIIERGLDFVLTKPSSYASAPDVLSQKRGQTSGKRADGLASFLEYYLDALKPGGRLVAALPAAFASLQAHRQTREKLADKYDLFRLAGFAGPNAKGRWQTVVAGFCKRDDGLGETTCLASLLDDDGNEPQRFVKQSALRGCPENVYNFRYDETLEKICRSIEDPKGKTALWHGCEWAVGVVTGDNKKFVFDKKNGAKYAPLLVGREVDRYRIAFEEKYLLFDKDKLKQAAPVEIYRRKGKLVYRFAGERLRFAYDDFGYFTLNNANILIPAPELMDVFYALALLNGSLLSFYHCYRFFPAQALKSRLETLPLALPDAETRRRLSAMAKEASELNGAGKRFVELDRQIDKLIFEIYGVDQSGAAKVAEWIKDKK